MRKSIWGFIFLQLLLSSYTNPDLFKNGNISYGLRYRITKE